MTKLIVILFVFLFTFLISKAQENRNQIPDTLNIELTKLNISDTIIIIGYIADNGEFGGYYDIIKIFKSNDTIYGELNKGTSDIRNELDELILKSTYNFIINIDTIKRNLFNEYVRKFNVLDSTRPDYIWPSRPFSINFNDNICYRWYPGHRWSDFEIFRDKLFKK